MLFARWAAGLLVVSSFLAANWPQWRGPQRDGISKETGLLKQWPAEGPPLVWRKAGLGEGYSTPAVVDDRIYLVSSEGLENEFVQALSAKDGSQLWSKRIGKVGNPDQRPPYPCARSTPTLDGDVLFALGSDGDLACLEAATGNIRWQKNLRTEFGGRPGEWAYSESPLVDGELVVVTPGGKDATFVALNKQTGELVRKYPVPEGDDAGYASIVIMEVDGTKQYINFLGKGLVGVDANTGKFLWRYDRTAQNSPANIITPVANNQIVYSGTAYGGGGAVKISSTPEGFAAEELYYDRKLPVAIGGAVLVGDHLYGTTRETMVCVDFNTGEVEWTKERGVAPASICYADGCLYLHGENDGAVALVEATPDEYRELGKFSPPEPPNRGRSKAWAYPIVADGRLYIHDWGTLWCFDVRAAGGAH
jgi:outer membrane protein assembly factor BamB